MKKEQFEFNELPYPTLARFGLTQEMIEDLPLCILKEIGKGGYSPVLPMRVTNENGEVIESRSRFAFIRMDSGEVDVVFYPTGVCAAILSSCFRSLSESNVIENPSSEV